MAKKKNNNISFPNITRKEVKIKKTVKEYSKCDNKNNLRVPNDTCSVITNFGLKNIDNFHLKINRYAQFDEELDRFSFDENIEEFNFLNYKNITKVDKEMIKQLNLNVYDFLFKLDYRLKIGAETSIYESSIRLHHIYGIPFIPSTTIKGVVRSYIELEGKLDKFLKIFGDENQEGKIIFFDAFPVTPPKIKVDIMTPHYGHYYSDGKAPSDTNSPIPINFLTIEDTTFQFFIASKETIDDDFITLFKEALQNHGIGGKTAVGYGYFNEI